MTADRLAVALTPALTGQVLPADGREPRNATPPHPGQGTRGWDVSMLCGWAHPHGVHCMWCWIRTARAGGRAADRPAWSAHLLHSAQSRDRRPPHRGRAEERQHGCAGGGGGGEIFSARACTAAFTGSRAQGVTDSNDWAAGRLVAAGLQPVVGAAPFPRRPVLRLLRWVRSCQRVRPSHSPPHLRRLPSAATGNCMIRSPRVIAQGMPVAGSMRTRRIHSRRPRSPTAGPGCSRLPRPMVRWAAGWAVATRSRTSLRLAGQSR